MMDAGVPVYCVWTRNSVRIGNFDVDHCLAFGADPNVDLSNLMPTKDRVQHHQKRRMPGRFQRRMRVSLRCGQTSIRRNSAGASPRGAAPASWR